jgi:imidazolonepropionase-like amidohydrolase
VLVEGSLIRAIGTGDLGAAAGAIEIDGQGRTLMPGLIDGHAHVMINQNFNVVETNMDITDMAYNAAIVMKRFLVDGFTTVRDMGGSTFGLARGLDQGRVVGPRLYPSGGFISQTSGHGDFRDRRSCERLGYLRRSPYVQRSSGESAAGLRGKDV